MLLDYLPNLLLSWSIQLTGALSPGPSVALIVGTAIARGRSPALQCAGGVAAGSAALALATVLGLTALLTRLGSAMIVVRFVGAAYLLWLALRSFKKAWTPDAALPAVEGVGRKSSPVYAGLLLQSTNPKAIMFWIAVASLGGIGDAPVMVKVVFVLGACLVSFVAHGAYGVALSIFAVRRVYARIRRWAEGAFGIFFLFASYKLATIRL